MKSILVFMSLNLMVSKVIAEKVRRSLMVILLLRFLLVILSTKIVLKKNS